MSVKSYQFFCGNCGYKRFTKGDDVQDLVEIKTSPIARGSPQLDPNARQTTVVGGIHQPAQIFTGVTVPPAIKQVKKFKCPKCGFVIKAKQLKEDFNEQADIQNNQSDESKNLPGSIE